MALVNNPKPESHPPWGGDGFERKPETPPTESPLRCISLSQKAKALRPNDYGGSRAAGRVSYPFRQDFRPGTTGSNSKERQQKGTTGESDRLVVR